MMILNQEINFLLIILLQKIKPFFPYYLQNLDIIAEVEISFYEKYLIYFKNNEDENVFLRHGFKMRGLKTMAENGFPGYEITVERKNSDI